MFVRGKVKVGWCGRKVEEGCCWMSWIMYTVSLQDWQAPKREGGAGGGWGLKIAGRRHWNTREKGTIQRTRKQTNYTNTVNTHAHTHRTRHEIKMTTACLLQHNFEQKTKQNKNPPKCFTSFTDDLSTWSIKDNLRFLNCWSVPAADLHWWLLHNVIIRTQPLRYVHVLQGGECLRMHAWNECVWMCKLPLHILIHQSLHK